MGGSLPLARALERRYRNLGGEIEYEARVTKIVVEAGRAVALRLADGREVRADAIISAADGHTTLFDLLGPEYMDDRYRQYYQTYKPFPSLVLVGLGVARPFTDQPQVSSGFSFPLEEPLVTGPTTIDRLFVRIVNFDPAMAPPGKTSVGVFLEADYAYWDALSRERDRYDLEKERVAATVVKALDRRFPGLASQVEMTDVATPVTLHHYTGNWQGSIEGWLPTPENMIEEMPKTLEGLKGFFMAGQWVAPGGGLPSGVKTGRDAVQFLCNEDRRRFQARRT